MFVFDCHFLSYVCLYFFFLDKKKKKEEKRLGCSLLSSVKTKQTKKQKQKKGDFFVVHIYIQVCSKALSAHPNGLRCTTAANAHFLNFLTIFLGCSSV